MKLRSGNLKNSESSKYKTLKAFASIGTFKFICNFSDC